MRKNVLVNDKITFIKTKWENESKMNLKEDCWMSALKRVNTPSSCARLSLIQFKVNRMHVGKRRHAKMFPDHNSSCICYNDPQSDLPHSFWSCPRLKKFWSCVFWYSCLSASDHYLTMPSPGKFGNSSPTLKIWSQKKTLLPLPASQHADKFLLAGNHQFSLFGQVVRIWYTSFDWKKIKFTLRRCFWVMLSVYVLSSIAFVCLVIFSFVPLFFSHLSIFDFSN